MSDSFLQALSTRKDDAADSHDRICDTVKLLTVDADLLAAAVSTRITKLVARDADLEALDAASLVTEAENIEAELQRAVKALQAKSAATTEATSAAAPIGPCTPFEGVSIDCGLVAAAAILAASEDVAYYEAELAKATAALEKKKMKGVETRDLRRSRDFSPTSSARAPTAMASPSKVAIEMLDAGIDATAEKTNLPRSTVVAAAAVGAVAGAAVAAAAAVVGMFRKR